MFGLPSPRQRIALLVMVGVVVSSCASSDANVDETERDDGGDVVEGGDVGVFRLRVGDCVQLPGGIDGGEAEEVAALEAISCTEEHTGEVVLVENQFFGDPDEFPGEEEAFRLADPRCIAALDAYTGTDFETSPFGYYALTPTQSTWDQVDDRELVCIGLTLDDDLVTTKSTTGSMRAG